MKNTQLSSIGLTNLLKFLDKPKEFKELHLENNKIDDMCINIMKTTLKNKQFKIFVSKNMVNQQLFQDDAIGKESNIIMVWIFVIFSVIWGVASGIITWEIIAFIFI